MGYYSHVMIGVTKRDFNIIEKEQKKIPYNILLRDLEVSDYKENDIECVFAHFGCVKYDKEEYKEVQLLEESLEKLKDGYVFCRLGEEPMDIEFKNRTKMSELMKEFDFIKDLSKSLNEELKKNDDEKIKLELIEKGKEYMHQTLMCMEKKDYLRLVTVSRQYAGSKLKNCYVFHRKDKTTDMYMEKEINGIQCVVFGWEKYNINNLRELEHGYDLSGIIYEAPRAKNGYIMLEFENKMLVGIKNEAKIKELEEAINLNRIMRNDFDLVYDNKEQIKEEEEEFE